MELQFAKYNPTGNTTILVETPLPRSVHASVADALMAESSVFAEQVGFLEPPVSSGAAARLQMMGGEFCGNATMCLAAHTALRHGINHETVLTLEVSGAEHLLQVQIRPEGNGFRCRVEMPLPIFIGTHVFDIGGTREELPFVRFPGISFTIPGHDVADARSAAREWCLATGSDAFGILLPGTQKNAIRPLVYVRETDSAVWEHGCGSGTSAMGCWLAHTLGGGIHEDITQPGGVIRVHALAVAGKIESLAIEGLVQPVCSGTAWITSASDR